MTDNEKREILNYDLNNFIQSYLGLTHKNKRYSCPFHNDKTPSLSVTYKNNKWIWKCFGCNKSGDIFSLVCENENVDFLAAIEIISKHTGINVTKSKESTNPKYLEYTNMMTGFSNRYQDELFGLDGGNALDYLRSRGLTDKTIKELNLGYVPHLEEKTERKNIARLGIDNRISFPIFENLCNSKKVIGMGYRTLDDVNNPSYEGRKYINDYNTSNLETIIDGTKVKGYYEDSFEKGHILYNFNRAYIPITSNNCVICVEGYMDVASLWQGGIKNVIGTMTSNLTDYALNLIAKVTSNVIMIFDSDEAGQNGARKATKKFIERGVNVYILFIDGGKDPADICRKLNFDKMKITKYINSNKKDGLLYLLDKEVIEPYKIKEFKLKRDAKKMARTYLSCIKSPEMLEDYTEYIIDSLNLKGGLKIYD